MYQINSVLSGVERHDKPNSHFSQLICEYTKKHYVLLEYTKKHYVLLEYTKKHYVLLAKHCSTQKMDKKIFFTCRFSLSLSHTHTHTHTHKI
jgi:uncharacterized pyridoxamine 5'-phosphate oxidase family protein